jgi:hypothetical protein
VRAWWSASARPAATPRSGRPWSGSTHTRGDGQGLPEGLRYPDLTPAAQQCLDSDRPDALIRAQAGEAAQQGIAATPTLRLQDRQSGKTLLLHGPVEGDALLSAIDLLAAGRAAPHRRNACRVSATCPGSHDLQGYDAAWPR